MVTMKRTISKLIPWEQLRLMSLYIYNNDVEVNLTYSAEPVFINGKDHRRVKIECEDTYNIENLYKLK